MMTQRTFDWRPPANRDHEIRYQLTVSDVPKQVPVIIGAPWYASFDKPQLIGGHPTIPANADLSDLRGGHCFCLKPVSMLDPDYAWTWYDQGTEGACVGYGISRAVGLVTGRLYNGYPLYQAAKTIDEWPGEDYSGTSVNAGMQVLSKQGPWRYNATRMKTRGPVAKDRATGYVWAKSAVQIQLATGDTGDYVTLLNSWGTDYPQLVRMHIDVLDQLIAQGAEACVPRFA